MSKVEGLREALMAWFDENYGSAGHSNTGPQEAATNARVIVQELGITREMRDHVNATGNHGAADALTALLDLSEGGQP